MTIQCGPPGEAHVVPLVSIYQVPPIAPAWGLSRNPDTRVTPFVLETRARQLDYEDSFRECRRIHASVETILSDERRADLPTLTFRVSRHSATSTPEGYLFVSRSEFDLLDLAVLR